MAKRFTDTSKYKKPFIRSLPGAYKLLWDFLYHDCDHAGIWIVDFETAQIYIGHDMKIEKNGAILLFNEDEQRIIELDAGKKWFIPGFIEFQYGHLSDKNRAHNSVISILKKFDLINSDLSLKIKNKGHTSPLNGAKDKDKDKEQDKDKEKDKDKSVFENLESILDEKLLIPEMFKVYKKHNPSYPGSIERDFKPLFSIAKFLSEQGGKRGSPEHNADEILAVWGKASEIIAADKFYKNKPLSTISNCIQEIIQIGLNGKQSASGGNVSVRSAFSKIDAMPG